MAESELIVKQIRCSATVNVVSYVVVSYVVFCDKKYMSSYLTFQMCDLVANYGLELWLWVFQHSPM